MVFVCIALTPLFAQDNKPPIPDYLRRRPIYLRQQWFYEQRAFPLGFIPGGARQSGLRQLDRMIAQQRALVLSRPRPMVAASSSSATSWSLIGPQPTNNLVARSTPTAGRVSAIALDPGNSNVIYLGGAEGGVWKSTNGGQSWTPLTDNQPSLATGSIAVDPNNPQSIWVGTGEMNFSGDSYYGVGFLHSTDAGASWTQIPASFVGPIGNQFNSNVVGGGRIGALAVQPGNSNVILAGVEVFTNGSLPGIYRSADGGSTWTLILSGEPGDEVVFDPANPSIAYATLGGTASGSAIGFYRSTDSGQSWNKLTGSPPPSGGVVLPSSPTNTIGRIAMGVAHNSTGNTIPTTIYLGFANSSNGQAFGVYKSVDGGTTWTQLTNAPDYCQETSTNGQCEYDNVVRVDPLNDSIVFIGGASQANPTTLFRSLDGGATWSEISSGANSVYLHSDTHALQFTPDGSRLYVGNDGGIWTTTDISNASVNWTNLNSTLAITEFYPGMSLHPTDVNTIIGGTQDNGTQLYGGNVAWIQVACGDGGWTAIDFANPNNVYASCQNINVRKSTSGGAANTFLQSESGINTADRVAFIPPLVIDPNNSQSLYYGTYRLYQTSNGAGSWVLVGNGADLTTGSGHLNAIAVAPGDGNTVWVGTSDGQIQVTTNATLGPSATFTNATLNLPTRAVTQIAIDPTNVSNVYVTLSGFNYGSNPPGHVFRSSTPTPSWQDISGDLPNTPVNDIVVDPQFPNTLYVATDVGVFRTTNGGTNWAPLVTGLPRVVVLSLKLHQATRTLVAGTHGRSVWTLVVAPVASPAPATVDFSTQTVSMTTSPQTATITNSGNLPLTIYGVKVTSNTAEFAVTGGTCAENLVVAAGDSCSVNLTFTPNAGGTRTGTLSVRTNAVATTTSIALTGTGSYPAGISLLPASVAFGNQLVYDNVIVPVNFFNNSGGALTISSIGITGAFAQANNCPATLANGAGCVISVAFDPQSLGSQGGTLTVNDSGGPHQAQISANAVDLSFLLARPSRVTHAAANLTGALGSVTVPGALRRGSQFSTVRLAGLPLRVNLGASPTKSLTLRNTEPVPMTIVAIEASNGFTTESDCPERLHTGSQCTVKVRADRSSANPTGWLKVRTSAGTTEIEVVIDK